MKSLSRPIFKILPLVQVDFNEHPINIKKIREICSKGMNIYCPPEDRALSWLNLLSLYPSNPQHFNSICSTMKKSYQNFINYYSVTNTEDALLSMKQCSSSSNGLKEQDLRLLNLIKSDVKRSSAQILYIISKEGNKCKTQEEKKAFQVHTNRIERILFVFAKVNPLYGYIQGFNELIIPFYYVMYSALNLFHNDIDIVEAVAYHALEFLLILSDLGSFFQLDFLHCNSKMEQFENIIKSKIPKLHQNLKALNISSIQYAYRWFNILFAQEHPLPQLLPLWDSILAHLNHLSLFEYCIGVARIQTVSDSIVSYCSYIKHDIIHRCIDKYKEKKGNYKNDLAAGKVLSILNDIQINNIFDIIRKANIIYETVTLEEDKNQKNRKSK